MRKRWQCYQIAMAVDVRPTSQKEQWIQGGKRGGNSNSQIPTPQVNMWLRSILREENFFVSHAKLTIFEVSPTLSNLTKLGSMCIPSHYAALFVATSDFPSVDGKTHCALNCGTYSICHTSERPREPRLQNYRHCKLVKSSSPVCIQNGLITLVS